MADLADLADLARFGQIGPDWPDSARLARFLGFGPFWPGGVPVRGFRPGPGGQIPGGAPNWHKSGGGGISCIRSLSTLSPGTYRSQIFGETRIGALGARILEIFGSFPRRWTTFSGATFDPPGPESGPPWPDLGPPLARPDWPDSASLASFGQFGQFRPDSAISA